MLLKILTNKYAIGGVILVVLISFMAWQELRYKDTLITLQETENTLTTTFDELSDSLEDNTRLLTQVEASEKAIKSYQSTVRVLESDRVNLNSKLLQLSKEDEYVKEVLDVKLPDSILDLLRE